MVRFRLEGIQRDFLWGGGAFEKKQHLVKWSIVCSNKEKGSLGVRCLSKLNRALLSKWSWWFTNERDSLWGMAINRKFGECLGGWCTCEVRGSYGIGLCREIRKEWEILLPMAAILVGDGRWVQFWKDIWCEEEALFTSFPSLFALAAHKDVMVVEVWDGSGVGPSLHKAFQ